MKNLDRAIDRLERASFHLLTKAGIANRPQEIFLRSWANLLKARAEWIWDQRVVELLPEDVILKLSAVELEIADSFLAEEDAILIV